MGDLTETMPKCLVPVQGVSLLQRQLTSLRNAGISDIAIITGYKRECFSTFNLVQIHNAEWASTQMVYSQLCADEWVNGDGVIVSYSDIFYQSSAVETLMSADAQICITYDTNWLDLWSRRFDKPLSDAETFKINADGTLKEIGKTAQTVTEIQGQYMGLIKFSSSGWNYFRNFVCNLPMEIQRNIHMTSLLQKIIESDGPPVQAIPYSDIWGEVDSQTDLEIYES